MVVVSTSDVKDLRAPQSKHLLLGTLLVLALYRLENP